MHHDTMQHVMSVSKSFTFPHAEDRENVGQLSFSRLPLTTPPSAPASKDKPLTWKLLQIDGVYKIIQIGFSHTVKTFCKCFV